jgi:non-canonical (house-cleaning) NTP pyrophosphatase
MLPLSSIKNIWIWTLKENKKQWLIDACNRLWVSDFSVTWYTVDTGVSDQPLNREETLLGSINRAKNCFKHNNTLDLACGAEAWVYFNDAKTKVFLIWASSLIDSDWYVSSSYVSEIELPPSFITPLLEGKELWKIMDSLRNTQWANHREWAFGFFTKNAITRSESFEMMMITAFVPWLHPELY